MAAAEFEKKCNRLSRFIEHCQATVERSFESFELENERDSFPYFKQVTEKTLAKLAERCEELEELCFEKEFDIEEGNACIRKAEQFIFKVKARLGRMAKQFEEDASSTSNSSHATTTNQVDPAMYSGPVPRLSCPTFEGHKQGRFAFKNFLSQFDNFVSSVRIDSVKLQLLKSHLRGYAAQIIDHLSLTDENFSIAIDILRAEFLDEGQIKNEIFRELLATRLNSENDLESVKFFLTKVKADLLELRSSFGLDFLAENTPGSELISHIIFSALPNILKKELIRLHGTNYPSIGFILKRFSEIIKSIECTSRRTPERPRQSPPRKFDKRSVRPNKPCLQNFLTKAAKMRPIYSCNLCATNAHQMSVCTKYPSAEDKLRRCREIKLCTRCARPGHGPDNCRGSKEEFRPCKVCEKKSHYWALCPKGVPTSTSTCMSFARKEQDLLLPIVEVVVSKNQEKCTFNCLLDTGSQRSYLSSEGAERLNCRYNKMPKLKFNVKTFLEERTKTLGEMPVSIQLGNNTIPSNILVDEGLSLDFAVRHLPEAIQALRVAGYRLAADFSQIQGSTVKVDGLIGVDLIQYMEPLCQISCMKGVAWRISSGIIPFGDVASFLPPVRSKATENGPPENSFSTMITPHNTSLNTMINFVLNPQPCHPDPLEGTFKSSSVERKLEAMFSLESVGIQEDSWSNYDDRKIGEFASSILYKDRAYYVGIPWEEEKLPLVPSNHAVSLRVLDRVVASLNKRGLLDSYTNVFLEQEREGIIERFEVSPEDYNKFIWIPHRPVIKSDEQCSTKMRPVFNCSLKVNGAPSLNEAVYPGINLMKNLLDLMLYFRSNKFVFLADIRKAFLMIKLRSEKDKNRFCFFMRVGEQLVCFRYTTLIFGFVASPFILNYLIQFHLKGYKDNSCAQRLSTRFYVDNLVCTSNSEKALLADYCDSVSIMSEGNFHLRSCNSNEELLREQMVADGTFVERESGLDKMLGYCYDAAKDMLTMSNSQVDHSAGTKRQILAQTAAVFDPLSLCLPVTVRGKLLLRDLWKLKVGWDEEIPTEKLAEWQRLAPDLAQLNELEFPRCAFKDDLPTNLFVFCDASKSAYGCAFYLVQDDRPVLLFAKAKVAPMSPRTLPTLELLAVYLALKCLKNISSSFCHLDIKNLFLAVDAQVVLAWLLSSRVNSRNVFVSNRLKDINVLKEEVLSRLGVSVVYKYVPTDNNPADLITRGLTLKKFRDNMQFWIRGPSWLSMDPSWPESDLKCLNEADQKVVRTGVNYSASINSHGNCLINLEKFSKLSRALRVAALVYQFVNRLRRIRCDDSHKAKVYLVRCSQAQFCGPEIEFLLAPKDSEPPRLVRDLNLFLDPEGIIRSRARIDRKNNCPYEVKYPILLPKYSPLTKLIIRDCHDNCKHLGVATTLCKLRLSGYWVPRARQAVKRYISDCFVCKKYNGLSFKYPKLTNLPKHRVNLIRPFLHTGVDFTGHLWVRSGQEDRKVYLLVFTCLSVRAVHVEVLEDMSVRSFVLALIRFSNQFGIPEYIYSDNARSFVSGCNLIKRNLASDEFRDRFGNFDIKHLTIPLYAPWMGSVWERMIKTIKLCLYKSIGRNPVELYELMTLLSDIQRAINSRPLTYRCSTDTGLDIIAPINFISPYVKEGLMLKAAQNESSIFTDPPSKAEIINSLETRDSLFNKFHKLWYDEYLLSLREQCKDLYQEDFENKLQVDDIVLVKNPAKPRPYWLLGRVVALVVGDDGRVRSAKVKRGDGNIQLHSLKHLYPLELSLTHNHQARTVVNEDTARTTSGTSAPSRPKRTSKKRRNDPSDPFLWY